MFFHLFFIEARKTFRHPALWVGSLGLVFLLAVIILIEHAQVSGGYRADAGLAQDILVGLSYFGWIGILVYAVTASVIAAFDYPDRSIQIWLTRGVPRTMLLFARLTVILFFGLLLVAFSVAVMLGISTLLRLLSFGSLDGTNLNWGALLPAILRIFWGAVPYLAMTMLFGVISRSPLFAAGATIVYGTVLENLLAKLADRFPSLIRYLPGQLAQVLQENNWNLDRLAPAIEPGAAVMPEARAILFIGFIFLTIITVALVVFSRQDLGG